MFIDISKLGKGCFLKSALLQKDIWLSLADWNYYRSPAHLAYLPPTMSPCDSMLDGDCLEHPASVFNYFKDRGVKQLIAEHKYMGSRGVILLCKSEDICERMFGFSGLGGIWTRTGNPFFKTDEVFKKLWHSLRPYFQKENIAWLMLDAEILPWNAKAEGLIKKTFERTGETALESRFAWERALHLAQRVTGRDAVEKLLEDAKHSLDNVDRYASAWQAYYGDPENIEIYPFHLLCGFRDGQFVNGFHLTHLEQLAILDDLVEAAHNVLLRKIERRVVNLGNPQEEKECIQAWQTYTDRLGEGYVFKPLHPLTYHEGKLVQPAIKCRGREYLRIIYGIDYLDNIDRLRDRQTKKKRMLAISEYALGYESVCLLGELCKIGSSEEQSDLRQKRFWYLMGVLALENEEIDKRL